MNRVLTSMALMASAGVLLGGCQSFSSSPVDQRVHTLSSTVTFVESDGTGEASGVTLGAGDELGRAMSEHYERLVLAGQLRERPSDPSLVQTQ